MVTHFVSRGKYEMRQWIEGGREGPLTIYYRTPDVILDGVAYHSLKAHLKRYNTLHLI